MSNVSQCCGAPYGVEYSYDESMKREYCKKCKKTCFLKPPPTVPKEKHSVYKAVHDSLATMQQSILYMEQEKWHWERKAGEYKETLDAIRQAFLSEPKDNDDINWALSVFDRFTF